ncbi:MAG: glycosyltransferase family 39 protein, partial [Spirochaetales bacterium]|nr:glycosyltransferase family 39 protein [Spirochaetales bacterium]
MNLAFRKNNSPIPKESYLVFGLIILLVGLIVATILLASVPPVDRDALTHHLFVPNLYLHHGGIYEIPEIPFSYYPMNLDLLYMIPLYFDNDIVPKYIHYFFALMTAGLIYRYLKKSIGTYYGLLGAIFFLSIPVIIKLSITVYVDLGVIFFTTSSLLLLLQWAERNFQTKFLVLAGLCCGLAAGTKYNGIISIVVLTSFVPIIYQRNVAKEKQSNSKALFYGGVFVLATLITFSPWLSRNYAWTGNPIYPLHNSLFQKFKTVAKDTQPADTENSIDTLKETTSKGSNAFISRRILYNEPWWQALLLPLRFFYEGQDDNPQFFDGKLTPFLLLLPALAFLIKSPTAQQRCEKNFLLFFAILYFFFTFFQESMRIRYIAPIVPPLVILSMYGLQGISNKLSSRIEPAGLKKMAVSLMLICITGFMLLY